MHAQPALWHNKKEMFFRQRQYLLQNARKPFKMQGGNRRGWGTFCMVRRCKACSDAQEECRNLERRSLLHLQTGARLHGELILPGTAPASARPSRAGGASAAAWQGLQERRAVTAAPRPPAAFGGSLQKHSHLFECH